jgi:hypothetical protein
MSAPAPTPTPRPVPRPITNLSAHNKPFLDNATETEKIDQLAEDVSFALKDLKPTYLDHGTVDEGRGCMKGKEHFRKLNKYERWLYVSYVKHFKEHCEDMPEWVGKIEGEEAVEKTAEKELGRKEENGEAAQK